MNDFLREIQEDLERQKWMTLWDKFGRWLVSFVIVVIVAAVGVKGWQAYRLTANEAATDHLLAASDAGTAEAYGEAAKQLTGDQQVLAKLMQASELAKTDSAAAETVYREIAASKQVNPALANLAASLSLPKEGLKPSDAFYLSNEERRGWQAIEAKEYGLARERFAMLNASPYTPESMKTRAVKVLGWLERQDVSGAK